jgi:hypothetical protein
LEEKTGILGLKVCKYFYFFIIIISLTIRSSNITNVPTAATQMDIYKALHWKSILTIGSAVSIKLSQIIKTFQIRATSDKQLATTVLSNMLHSGIDEQENAVVVQVLPGYYCLIDGNHRVAALMAYHENMDYNLKVTILTPSHL